MYQSAHGGFGQPPRLIDKGSPPCAYRFVLAAASVVSVGKNPSMVRRYSGSDFGPYFLLLPLLGAPPVVSSVGAKPDPIPSM